MRYKYEVNAMQHFKDGWEYMPVYMGNSLIAAIWVAWTHIRSQSSTQVEIECVTDEEPANVKPA